MTATAEQILEQVRKLSPADQWELREAILRETTASRAQPGERRKTIADVAGKYSPQPAVEAKDHDDAFAEAITASKAQPHAA